MQISDGQKVYQIREMKNIPFSPFNLKYLLFGSKTDIFK